MEDFEDPAKKPLVQGIRRGVTAGAPAAAAELAPSEAQLPGGLMDPGAGAYFFSGSIMPQAKSLMSSVAGVVGADVPTMESLASSFGPLQSLVSGVATAVGATGAEGLIDDVVDLAAPAFGKQGEGAIRRGVSALKRGEVGEAVGLDGVDETVELPEGVELPEVEEVGARMGGAVAGVTTGRDAAPPIEEVAPEVCEDVAMGGDLPALEAAAEETGAAPEDRKQAVRSTANAQRAKVAAEAEQGAAKLADQAEETTEAPDEVTALEQQGAAEMGGIQRGVTAAAEKIDSEHKAAETAAKDATIASTSGAPAQMAQAEAAGTAKGAAEKQAKQKAAQDSAQRVRDEAQTAAQAARAKGEADAQGHRAKGQGEAEAAKAEAQQRGAAARDAAQAAAAAQAEKDEEGNATGGGGGGGGEAEYQQAVAEGEQRAAQVMQQAEQAAEQALAEAARTAEGLIAEAETEAQRLMSEATEEAAAIDGKTESTQGSLVDRVQGKLAEVADGLSAKLGELTAGAEAQKATLAATTEGAIGAIESETQLLRTAIEAQTGEAAAQIAGAVQSLQASATAAASAIDGMEDQLIAKVGASVDEATRADLKQSYESPAMSELANEMAADAAATAVEVSQQSDLVNTDELKLSSGVDALDASKQDALRNGFESMPQTGGVIAGISRGVSGDLPMTGVPDQVAQHQTGGVIAGISRGVSSSTDLMNEDELAQTGGVIAGISRGVSSSTGLVDEDELAAGMSELDDAARAELRDSFESAVMTGVADEVAQHQTGGIVAGITRGTQGYSAMDASSDAAAMASSIGELDESARAKLSEAYGADDVSSDAAAMASAIGELDESERAAMREKLESTAVEGEVVGSEQPAEKIKPSVEDKEALKASLKGVKPEAYEEALAKLPPEQQAAARALEEENALKYKMAARELDDEKSGWGMEDTSWNGESEADNRLKFELKEMPAAMREAVVAKMTDEEGKPTAEGERAATLLKEAQQEIADHSAAIDQDRKEVQDGASATEAAAKAGNPKAVSAALDKMDGEQREKALEKLTPEAREVAEEQLELRKKRLEKAAEALEKAMKGGGTDEIAVVKTLSGLSPTEAEELEEIYDNMGDGDEKRSLRKDLKEEFKGDDEKGEREFITAVLNGQEEAKDMSVDLAVKYIESEAGATFNTNEKGINDLLRAQMNNPEGAKRIAEAYEEKTGKSLKKELADVMDEAELKEGDAYIRNDMATANVAAVEQGDGERSMMVVNDAKEDGELGKLTEDIETQTGAKATELLADSVDQKELASVAGDIKEAQTANKEKLDASLKTAQDAFRKRDPKAYAETEAKMKDVASKLNASLTSGGVGNDFETTDLLRGLKPEEAAILKEQFAQGDYGDLDKVIDSKLSGKDRKAAKAALTGDKVQSALALVEQSADGVGTNTVAWKQAMEVLTDPADRERFKAECEHQGIDYAALNKSENTGSDRDMMEAQAIIDPDERMASVAAVEIEAASYGGKIEFLQQAIADTAGDAQGISAEERNRRKQDRRENDLMAKFSNLGTNDQAMLDAEEKLTTPKMRELLDKKLKENTGKGVFEIHAEETSESTKKALDLYAQGDMEGGQALRMIAASEAIVDDDEDGMSKAFEGMDPAKRARIEARMDEELKATGRGGVDEWRKSELSDAQIDVAEERAKDGKVNDVTAMALAGETTLGLGKDGAKMMELCKDKTPAQMDEFRKKFAEAGHGDLDEFLRSRAGSAGEKRDFEILIEGNYGAMPPEELEKMASKDPDALIKRVKDLHMAAKGGTTDEGDLGNDIGNALTDVYSDQGKILDKRLASVKALEKKLAEGGSMSDEEKAELINNVKFMSGDQTAFTDNKNKVVNASAEVVGTVVEVGVTMATGSDQAGTIAGGLTKMAVKANMNGARYSKDQIVEDVGSLAVEALVGKMMDTKAAKAAFKNPVLKEVVESSIEGAGTSAMDTDLLRDAGKFATAVGTGAGQGGMSALGSSATSGLTGNLFGKKGIDGDVVFDSKRAAQLNGAVGGLAEATTDAALTYDPSASTLDQATGLLKELLKEGAKGSAKGGKAHDASVAQAREAGERVRIATDDDTEEPEGPKVRIATDGDGAEPKIRIATDADDSAETREASAEAETTPLAPAVNRFGDKRMSAKGKRQVAASTPDGDVTADLVKDQVVVRYPATMTDPDARRQFAVDAAAKLGVTLDPDAIDAMGDNQAVTLRRQLEIRSQDEVAAAARSLYDMTKVHNDDLGTSDLNPIEQTLREAMDPDRDPKAVPFKNKCEQLSTAWQGALAELGIHVPVMHAAGSGREGHKFLVYGDQILCPSAGQYSSGDVVAGKENQYEPFIGTAQQLVDRVQRQIDAGQMPGYASAADAVAKEYGIHVKPGGEGFTLDPSVQPLGQTKQIAPTSVEETRRLMDDQRSHGIPEGQGLPPDLVAKAGGGGGNKRKPPSAPRPPLDANGMPIKRERGDNELDPDGELAKMWEVREEQAARRAELIARNRPDLTPEQALARARKIVDNDHLEAEGLPVNRLNERQEDPGGMEFVVRAPVDGRAQIDLVDTYVPPDIRADGEAWRKAVDEEKARLREESPDLTEEELDTQAGLKVYEDEVALGTVKDPFAKAEPYVKALPEVIIDGMEKINKPIADAMRALYELYKGSPADPKKVGKAVIGGAAEVAKVTLKAALPSEYHDVIDKGIDTATDYVTEHAPDAVENGGRLVIAGDKLTRVPSDLRSHVAGLVLEMPPTATIIDRAERVAAIAEKAEQYRQRGMSMEDAAARARDELAEGAMFEHVMREAAKTPPPDGDGVIPLEAGKPRVTADAEHERVLSPEAAAKRTLEEARRDVEARRFFAKNSHGDPRKDADAYHDQLAVKEQELRELEERAAAAAKRQRAQEEQEARIRAAEDGVALADIAVHHARARGKEPSSRDLATLEQAEHWLAQEKARLAALDTEPSTQERSATGQRVHGAGGAPAPITPDADAQAEIEAPPPSTPTPDADVDAEATEEAEEAVRERRKRYL